MRYRHSEVLAATDFGGAATEIIDLSVVDPISRLTLIFKPIGGSDTAIAHVVAAISRLELIDGSDILYSLTGPEGHALNIFEAPTPMATHLDYRNGGTPYIIINIDFGRYLWDTELAFVPGNFANPQIRLTHNEAAWDGSCGSHSFQIYAQLFDEKAISPMGFLMNKEIKAYIGAAGGYEYTDLPTDYPMRKLIIQGFELGRTVRSTVEDIKLSEDNDKRVPIDGDIYNLRGILDPVSGECVDHIVMRGTQAGNRVYCTPGQFYAPQASTALRANYLGIAGIAGNTFVVEAQTGDVVVRCLVNGKNPHNCVCIPFGMQNDIEDWYDLANVGSLKLRINGGGRAQHGMTRIVTQQLRRY